MVAAPTATAAAVPAATAAPPSAPPFITRGPGDQEGGLPRRARPPLPCPAPPPPPPHLPLANRHDDQPPRPPRQIPGHPRRRARTVRRVSRCIPPPGRRAA